MLAGVLGVLSNELVTSGDSKEKGALGNQVVLQAGELETI